MDLYQFRKAKKVILWLLLVQEKMIAHRFIVNVKQGLKANKISLFKNCLRFLVIGQKTIS
jgi:hypothetical protein